MTRFLFYYKYRGYLRWRRRTGHRRTLLLVLPLPATTPRAAATLVWRCPMPATVLLPMLPMLRIGDFVVGEDGDPQLLGHPDIRY